MVWFGIQINVSTPHCFFPFCVEGSRREGEFRLMIANESPINVKRPVIVYVCLLQDFISHLLDLSLLATK